jgi:hypothetical protein
VLRFCSGCAFVKLWKLKGCGTANVQPPSGVYARRSLSGEKPADLLMRQPRKIQLAINLQIAKCLGLAVPPRPSALADAIIEWSIACRRATRR